MRMKNRERYLRSSGLIGALFCWYPCGIIACVIISYSLCMRFSLCGCAVLSQGEQGIFERELMGILWLMLLLASLLLFCLFYLQRVVSRLFFV